jgi:hypothetical protein
LLSSRSWPVRWPNERIDWLIYLFFAPLRFTHTGNVTIAGEGLEIYTYAFHLAVKFLSCATPAVTRELTGHSHFWMPRAWRRSSHYGFQWWSITRKKKWQDTVHHCA